MSRYEVQDNGGTSTLFDKGKGSSPNFQHQNERIQKTFASSRSVWNWHHPPPREEQFGSTSKAVQVYEVPTQINNPILSFQIEHGILISELLRNCNLRLEELKFSENRAECSVWKENGALQTFVIERNPKNHLEYSVNYNTEGGLPIDVRSAHRSQKNRKDLALGFEKSALQEENYREELRNDFANRLSGDDLEKLQPDIVSSNELINSNYAPYPKPIRLHFNTNSNDLSLYEETTQFKTGDVTTVERFQRYKIRPSGKCGKGTDQWEASGSGDQEHTEISPRVTMAGQRCEEKVKQHVSGNLKALPSPNKANYEFLRPPGSFNRTNNNLNATFPGTPTKHSLKNYYINNMPRNENSSKFSLRKTFKNTIPLVKYIKPQARHVPFNITKSYILPYKSKLKGSVRKFRKTVSKDFSNDGFYARLNQSEALGSVNVLDIEGTPVAIVNGKTQLISQTQTSDEVATAVSKRFTLGCISKENNSKRIFLSNKNTVNEESNQKKIIVRAKQNALLPPTPPKNRVLANAAPVGNEVNTYLGNTLPTEHESDTKKDFNSQMKTSNVIKDSVTRINTQSSEDVLNVYNFKKHQEITSSEKSCVEAGVYGFELNVTRCSGALNGEEQVNLPIKSHDQELNESISDAPVSRTVSNTREVDMIEPFLETKDQELSRLKAQIGKTSLTSDNDHSDTLKLKFPQNISPSKHIESPEVLWHNQKVKLNREDYLRNYGNKKLMLPQTGRTQNESPRCYMEDGANQYNRQSNIENYSEHITDISSQTIGKDVNDGKPKDEEQCCLM